MENLDDYTKMKCKSVFMYMGVDLRFLRILGFPVLYIVYKIDLFRK